MLIGGRPCRAHSQGREARRASGAAAEQVLIRRQSQDRESARIDNPTRPSRDCRSGDRIERSVTSADFRWHKCEVWRGPLYRRYRRKSRRDSDIVKPTRLTRNGPRALIQFRYETSLGRSPGVRDLLETRPPFGPFRTPLRTRCRA
jgi:hypothetical protein